MRELRRVVVDHDLDQNRDQRLSLAEVRAGIDILGRQEVQSPSAERRKTLVLLRRYEMALTGGKDPIDLVGAAFRGHYAGVAAEVRDLLFRADVKGGNEGRPQLFEVESFVQANPAYAALQPAAKVALADALKAPRDAGPVVGKKAPRRVSDPRSVTAAEAEKAIRDVSTRPPLNEVRAKKRSFFEKLWAAIGTGLTAVTNIFGKAGELFVDGVGYLVSGVAWVVASPAMLFGVKPAALWNGIRRATKPVFGTLAGVASGVLQTPFVAIGVGLGTVRNIASLKWAKSGKAALETLFQPILGTVLAAGTPLLMGFKGLSDSLTESRPLTEKEKAELRYDFSDEMLDRVRLFEGDSILHRIMGGMASAFTLGNDIYLNVRPREDLLRHELIHSTQYKEALGGRIGFLTDYWSDLLSNMITTDPFTAYENTRAEREAYTYENDPTP